MKEIDKRILDIDGWMAEQDLSLLGDLVSKAPDNALIVEIGAWKGRSTAVFYTQKMPSQTIVSIDNWLGQPDIRFSDHKEAVEKDLFLEWCENMGKFGIKPLWYRKELVKYCTYLRMDSTDASTLFNDQQIYMVFDDGDHSMVDKSLEVWYPKVSDGGIYCGHDWTWGNGIVSNQVRKHFEPDYISDGDIWVRNKPINK